MDPILVAFIISAIVSAVTYLVVLAFAKGKGLQSQPDRPSGPVSISM
mgnify:CR=1 FL=1